MQEFANVHSMRNEILSLMTQQRLENDCYLEMLDFTIDLFESQGLGTEYYGYHNINHELEVTYVSLLIRDKCCDTHNILYLNLDFQTSQL